MVETALGLIVFVTVLIFGIHFAELTVMQMKVTEAAASAIWDSTAGQMHVVPTSYNEVKASVTTAQDSAQARYLDFDGRRRIDRGRGPVEVYTQASGMQVECRTDVGLGYRGVTLLPQFWLIYRDNRGMDCRSEAWVQSFGASRIGSFLEGSGGMFKASQADGTALNSGMRVCGLGRPAGLNGQCRGRFTMLIDDWGLANASGLGGNEGNQCPSIPFGFPCLGGNMPFWTAVNMVYTPTSLMFGGQNGADEDMLEGTLGDLPSTVWIPGIASPTSFHMNFMGEETLHLGLTPWAGDGSSWVYQTTPFYWFPTYGFAYTLQRDDCYLGKKCNFVSGRGGDTP